MKKILLILFVFLFVIILKAQKVFSVDYVNQADVKVFVEDYESRADLVVFKVDFQSQSGKNDGNCVFGCRRA